MIINIDETKRIKRLVIEFGDSDSEELSVDSDELDIPLKPKKQTSKSKKDRSREVLNNRDSQILSTYYDSNSTSQEIVEKPVIPDVEDREVEVAEDMQNLIF